MNPLKPKNFFLIEQVDLMPARSKKTKNQNKFCFGTKGVLNIQRGTSLTEEIVFLQIKSFHDLRGACCLITKDYIIDVHLTFSKSSLFAPHGHLT